MLRFLLALVLVQTSLASAQNLMDERIWKVSSRKKSIFLDSGVFHHNSSVVNAGITGVRSSGASTPGYERVVIDFNTPSVPKLYGHISPNKTIKVDFFNTSMAASQQQLKNSKNVRSIDFISVDGKSVSMDLSLKGKSSFDIFYLENPGRLVIDIR